MKEQLQETNGHVQFDATFTFTIPAEVATDILACPAPGAALIDYLNSGVPITHSSFNRVMHRDEIHFRNDALDHLRDALGDYLATKKVEERRMLTAPKDVAMPMEVA